MNSNAPEADADGPRIDDFPPGTEDLVGLALSGGGIRAATFALGALEALRDRDVLKAFDYLSTVSGGGFTGGWWSAWLSRPPNVTDGDPFPPAEQLEPSRFPAVLLPGDGGPEQPVPGLPQPMPTAGVDPVHHLRLFANYLTPRKGVFSADTWRGITFYLRSLLFTWLMLLPLLLAAVMAAQWLFAGNVLHEIELGDLHVASNYLCSLPDRDGPQRLPAGICQDLEPESHAHALRARLAYAAGPVVVLAVLLATLAMLWLLHATAHPVAALFGVVGMIAVLGVLVVTGTGAGEPQRLTRVAGLVVFIAVWSHGISVFIEALDEGRVRHDLHRTQLSRWQARLVPVTLVAAAVLAVGGFGHELVWFLLAPETGAVWQGVRKAGGWGTVLAAIIGAAFASYKTMPSGRSKDSAEQVGRLTRLALLIVPYLVLGVLLATLSWLGWAVSAAWARRQAALPAPSTVVLWATLFPLGFAIFEWVQDRRHLRALAARHWWRWSLIENSILLGAGLTVAVELAWRATQWLVLTPARGSITITLARVLMVFSIGLTIGELLQTRARWNGRALLLAALAGIGFFTHLFGVGGSDAGRLVWPILVFVVLWVIGIGWMADPNLLSMQNFYRARLIRAYLGASNPERPAAITQEAARDDVPLTQMVGHMRGGPYHLVNTTLNLAGARDLAAGQRSAANFVFSHYFCGSGRTAYRWTRQYMGGGLTLGTAVGISGAAASPSMGRYTPSLPLVMLMALLNVRLGSWMPNPRQRRWRERQAHLWPFYLAHEFLARSTDTESYCYLTDGGHFDNTGLYALVERGCRYIVVLDVGADPDLACEDIGQAVRMCRIDFGAEINLDVGQFRRLGREGLAARHVVAGDVVYHPEHWQSLGRHVDAAAARTGRIIWIKPMVTPADPADVRQYHRQNRDFPQQTTLDQWYDEAQFESYRKLGFDSVMSALANAPAPPAAPGRAWVRPFFTALGAP